jgi:hypothetical protein
MLTVGYNLRNRVSQLTTEVSSNDDQLGWPTINIALVDNARGKLRIAVD